MAYLEGKGFELNKRDMKNDAPSRELLDRLIDDEHPEEYLNKRSPAYKERNLGSRTLTKKQVIELMMEDANLIRRPVVVRGPKKAIFGFDQEGYDELG